MPGISPIPYEKWQSDKSIERAETAPLSPLSPELARKPTIIEEM